MAEEVELASKKTAWVRGATDTKMGTAILTSERLLFIETKFLPVGVDLLSVFLAARLQKHHEEEGGELFELPLASITGAERQKKLLNKDRIALSTTEGEYLLNEGWSDWGPQVREALTTHQGRRVLDDGPDAWRVEPV